MLVWPLGLIPAICAWMSWRPPSGAVWMTQWAASSNATTPSSSLALSAEAARRMASLPMSTLRTPPVPLDPPPMPPLKLLQWQASIEPDLSMTTTSATSGCFSRSRTPMSTGSVASSGVSA